MQREFARMKTNQYQISSAEIEALRQFDACTLANAIETFHERLRNEGFADSSLHCLFPELPPMLGFAATVKIRGSAPPTADGPYRDRTDWWDYVNSLPTPRVIVVQDVSTQIGRGSLLGAVHVNIAHVLGCVGAVTNGSVRDLPAARELGFPLFSGGVAVSHAYVHIIDFGQPVEIAGLKIESGDLLQGDMHGVQTIPINIAAQLPAVAARIHAQKQELIQLCQSPGVTIEKLRAAVKEEPS